MPAAVRTTGGRAAGVVVLLAVFMTNLDLWIVNVALPSMAASFPSGGAPASLGALSWVLNAYALTLGATLVFGFSQEFAEYRA